MDPKSSSGKRMGPFLEKVLGSRLMESMAKLRRADRP